MRVAVTGATGFLGTHLTNRLLEEGHEVRILARDPERAVPWRDRVAGVTIGDIADRAALGVLVAGCDRVFHLVSNFRTASGPPESYWRVNVEGTRVALEAARSAGATRFIHCSTIGVHGHVRSTPADEEAPYNPGDLYQRTKVESEGLCRDEMARGGMEVVVVRPCSIYGPGDLRMLKMFRMLRKGRFFMLGPGRENFHAVYVDDLIDGFHRVGVTPGLGGETFIVGGGRYVPLSDYVATAARAVGAPPPRIRLPYWPVYAVSAVCEAVCVPLRVEPPLHRRRVRFFRNNRAFSIQKARDRLGYTPRVDLDEGMRRTVDWYRAHGHL